MAIRYRLLAADALDAPLLSAWRRMQAADPRFGGPFFCPEFTQAVGRFRADARVTVVEDAGQPVCLFPHQRGFAGLGQPIGGPLSDFHGIVAEQKCAWSIEALLRAANLSVWAFDHLVGDADRFLHCTTQVARSPRIDLDSGYERYAEDRRKAGSDYIRKTEGLARKLGREHGALDFTLHDPLAGTLEQLFSWKSRQYREAGLPDAFAVGWTRALLADIARTQTPGFAGVCSALRVGGRLVAVHMGMRSKDVLHYWFPAYDPEFAKYSPGIVLLLRVAEAAAAAGVRTIDLGKGDAQYKARLMTSAMELREGAVELPSALTCARRLLRAAQARAAHGSASAILRLPIGVIRRFARIRRYR